MTDRQISMGRLNKNLPSSSSEKWQEGQLRPNLPHFLFLDLDKDRWKLAQRVGFYFHWQLTSRNTHPKQFETFIKYVAIAKLSLN